MLTLRYILAFVPVVQCVLMEEAYAQLYQEFVRLRTLCLRQASLLRQLTAALKLQRGETNGDLTDFTSMPGQLDSEYPIYLNTPAPPPVVLTTTASSGVQSPSVNLGNFSDLLVEGISRLSTDTPAAQRKDSKPELSVPQSLTSQMMLSHGAFIDVDKHQHLGHNGEGGRAPVSTCPLLCPDALSQSGGAMMSDVVLQSHVCEFCQAVFPGDTTTRGQYLQHIYTHIT